MFRIWLFIVATIVLATPAILSHHGYWFGLLLSVPMGVASGVLYFYVFERSYHD